MEQPLQNDVQTVIDGTNVDDVVSTSMQKETNISEKEVSDVDADDTKSSLRNIYCDPCKYDGTVHDVTGFCVSCTEYLCQSCQRYHKKNKLTRSHKVLIDDNIPKDPAAFRAIKEHMECSRHPGNELRFECVVHNAIICALCFAHAHRHCEDIVDMETYEGHSTAEAAEPQLFANLIDRLKECKQKKMNELEEMGNQHEKIQQQCNALVEKWKKHIDNLGIFLLNEADAFNRQEIKCVKDCLNECTDMETFLDTHAEIVSTLALYGSKKEIAVVSRTLSERLAMCEGLLNKTENSKAKQLVLHEIRPTTVNFIGSVSVKEQMVVVPKETNCATVPKEKDVGLENTNILKENMLNVSLASIDRKLETAFSEDTVHKPISCNIDEKKALLMSTKSMNDEKPCSISAITKLKDGRIVVADVGNQKLKLLSGHLIFLSEIKLPSVPADICSIGNTVFVCFQNVKGIFSYTVRNAIIGDPVSYATKHLPVSLSVFDENTCSWIVLFRTEGHLTSSVIEVRQGNIIKFTLKHSDAKEFSTIKETKQVVRYGDSCLVMAETNQISCYRVDKQLVCTEKLWDYKVSKENKLKTPRGLVCNTSGNIYVCGKNSSNVHSILAREEIVSSINGPLCVLADNNKIVVGCRNDDNLHVYNIN